ncbi:hypothetical protein [Streptomyces sp. Caat 7-52]|uniref:hypothetical protein n=1 Tax=Streptomyces sp. Caat 7-52 TaxID=2949637 RepID=UPI0020357FAE|nr:hypothetical protein [Streptomyces sp. Caat 7-52]
MADEQYKWLNRETAERLLRGEPLEAVDASTRDQAERLSQALGALSAEAAPASGELPGEQAALAAFRKAREAAEAERTAAAPARPSAPGTDAALVRIGAPVRTGIPAGRRRRARPVRLALAAALAVGTLGGVAMAAGGGVLPTPFGDEHPRPGASVTAGTTTGPPLTSPSSPVTSGGETGTGAPTGRAEGSRGAGSDEAAGKGDDKDRGGAPGFGAPSATSGTGWHGVAAACRALRDGRGLDTGRKRALENLAGGPARVTRYCKVLLAAGGSASGSANGGTGNGQDGDEPTGKDGKSKGDKGDKDKGDRDKGDRDKGDRGKGDRGKGGGRHRGRGDDDARGHGHGHRGHHGWDGRHRDGAAPAPAPSAHVRHPAHPGDNRPTPSPSPTYTAL